MLTLVQQIPKNSMHTLLQYSLVQKPDKQNVAKSRYTILNENLAATLQNKYKKMVIEKGTVPKKFSWVGIKNFTILDQDFKKDLKINLKNFVRNFCALLFFGGITIETVWIWDAQIMACLSGWALFSVYCAQKFSSIPVDRPLNKKSERLANVSHMNNLFVGSVYGLFTAWRLLDCPITQIEAALHIFLLWNFYKNIVTSNLEILSEAEDLCDKEKIKNISVKPCSKNKEIVEDDSKISHYWK